MTEKTTVEFDKNDWISIIKENNWKTDYDVFLVNSFLDVKTAGDLLSHSLTVQTAEGLIIRFVLDEFLALKNLKIERTVDIYRSDESSARFSNIEYLPKVYKSCLENGAYFLTLDDKKYVFDLSEFDNAVTFRMTSNKDTAPTCEQLLNELQQYANEHNFLRKQKISASCEFIHLEQKYSWDDLVLSQSLKEELKQNLSNLIDYFDIYKKNNLPIKRGLILHGLPGTGKSLLGKVLCSVIDWTFVWVTPNDILKPRGVKNIVDLCRTLTPVVLFLEDIDLYGSQRETNSCVEILGELLNRLDGLQENKDIITIATTNKVQILEKALFDRPGRFDKVLEFPAPNEECRYQMIQQFTKNLNLDPKINLKKLSDSLGGLTGAHVKEFVNLSIIYAIDDKSLDENEKVIVKQAHLDRALNTVKKKDFGKIGFATKDDDDDDDFGCPDLHRRW